MADTEHDFSTDLTAYIDGELPDEHAAKVKAALDRDPKLRALEQRLRRVIGAVEALPQPEPAPSAMRRNVLAAIEQPSWRERLSSWLTPGRLAPAGLVAAAAAVAVVVVGRRRPNGDEVDEDQLLMAQHLDVVEDLDLVDVDSPDDLDVIASLHELEVER